MSREKLSDSPLKKVVWQAVIDGPLMSYTSSQQYHNDRKELVHISSSPFTYFIFSGQNEQGKSVALRP